MLSELCGYLHDEGLEDVDLEGGNLAAFRQDEGQSIAPSLGIDST